MTGRVRTTVLTYVWLAAAAALYAQVKSPEVLPDHRVTFRLVAPKATEVSVSGDWVTQGRGTAGNMQKDDQGVWSVTLGPFVPDYYTYTFTVNGVRLPDPLNPIRRGTPSLLEVPGDETAFAQIRRVPHGEMRELWYYLPTLDMQRRIHLYTPPGYESGNARYPVLFLLYGIRPFHEFVSIQRATLSNEKVLCVFA
jgi:hypothetical protein